MHRLLDPRNDFVFKRIFGSDENKDVLLAFLNNTLIDSNESPLTEIIQLNPYLDKDALHDKQSILDIHAKTIDGKLINIEIQLFNRYDIDKRTLFYWSKLYSGQLTEGQSYKELKKSITINILNFNYIVNERYHNIFHLREDHTNIILTRDIEIHFLELAKLNEQNIYINGGLVNWLLFLKGTEKENWEVLAMNEPALQKAMDTLEFLSQNEEARRLYEMRQKALHDEASLIEGAKAEGMEKGIEKGIEIGQQHAKIALAKKLIAKEMDISFIIEVTGLSEEDIENLSLIQ
ncbi:hypothetical protein GCM10008018_22190 [Paenibacillus marchantiophytorum]|uniref:Rpn family recombination-promoting nuclease/putative transposase n=1 Tax=Paenibacillus marchantiophytorum TaxID=1619310 RepID=A0ABQ1EL04_9BACL|nr:Rpn family recombination-promoting nuclease/putative transposase [Paenibacillus marchantiophytorum]GFZ76394.1 hypothetical protein GCM10008018_22190 [Paenibacillus marchantiophytorum]